MIYIVAGNYKEYTDYVYKNQYKDERYTYVQDVDYIRGLNEIKGFYIGTYYNRPDIEAIKEYISIIKSTKRIKKDPPLKRVMDKIMSHEQNNV
jgi:hypothetical protein